MSQSTINTGTTANDGTGDSLRAALVKANANFTELYARSAASVDEYADLDAAFAAHDVVVIPDGTTVTISANFQPPRAGLSLIGQGRGSVLAFSGNNRRIHLIEDDFTLANLMVDGGKSTVGYETTNNYDYGIRVGESVAAQVTGLRVHGVVFKDIGLDGILLENCGDVVIDDDCEFINCRRWGVAVLSGTHGVDDVYIGGRYYCDYNTGPSGKEYPLGAIDVEPDTAGGGISNVIVSPRFSDRGEVAVQTYSDTVTSTPIRGATVVNAPLHVSNIDDAIVTGHLIGTDAYLQADLASDGDITQFRHLDVTFDTGRAPVLLASKRANLLPADYGNEAFFNVANSSSGTGATGGLVAREIDGQSVLLREMSIGAGTGNYVLRHDCQATVTAGDQVVIALEIERTDANTATGNFLAAVFGSTLFDKLVLPAAGVSTFLIAGAAASTVVNPRFTFGLSGTPGAAVTCLIRKCFVWVNPQRIGMDMLRVVPTISGGTVTQATSKSTGVTLNKRTGTITLNNAALAAGTAVSFTLTNSECTATDLIPIQHQSGGTLGAYTVTATPGSGSATITVRNNTAGSLAEALVLRFALLGSSDT